MYYRKSLSKANLILLLTLNLLSASVSEYKRNPKRNNRPAQSAPPGETSCNETDQNVSGEQRLLQHLLRNYDSDARGVADMQDTVTVSISYLLLRIQGLDERSQVLTTTGLIITDWTDVRLKWLPEDYDNVTNIVLKPHRIWLPELALMNGATELAPDFRHIRALVNHTGHVHWEPGGVFMTTCDIEILHFPFDEQLCAIQFGSWAYIAQSMNITSQADRINIQGLRQSGEWDVMATTATSKVNIIASCCPDMHYTYVEFTLYLRRRYMFYVMNIIVPCSLLSVLVMIVFCLPPDGGEKISLGISVLLAFTVFLLMVAENVPRTSLKIPIIVLYLTITMGLGTASVCLTVFILSIHHRDASRPVPRWVKIVVLRYLSSFLCVSSRQPVPSHRRLEREWRIDPPDMSCLRSIATNVSGVKPTTNGSLYSGVFDASNSDSDGDKTIASSTRENARRRRSERTCARRTLDWKEVANVLDRLFFWIVLITMTAATLAVFLVPFTASFNPSIT